MTMPRLTITALLLCAALGGHALAADIAATKHAITHEDVWLMKRIGAPTPSPDGKWAVFSVTDPAYDSKEQWSDLWIKSLTDDTPARRLTFSKGGESAVNWSPDSRQLVFVAKRDGDDAGQLYRIDVAGGGEAQRLTTLTLGARQPKFSPDGKQLLFVSDIFPGTAGEEDIKKVAKERKDRKYTARAYESFPPRFFDKWLDDKQVRLFVMAAAVDAKPRDLLSGTRLAALPGFGGGQGDEGQTLDAIWSQDGKAVVFSASINRDEAARASGYTQIFSVPAAGGEAAQLTQDKRSYHALKFSKDGKTLFSLTEAEEPGQVYDVSRLASFAWPMVDAKPTVLTASLDRSISRFALPDGARRVVFSFEHAGLEQLHSIDYAGGEVRAEASPPTGAIGALNAGGKAVVGVWESAINPPEVYAFGNGAPKRLTSFNTERAAAIDWQAPEHFWFKASDGRMIHNMIVKPAGFDPAKKYPLFAVIHGGAANMWRDQFVLRWNYHLLAQPGYVVLLTDYKGSTGYGEAFARAIQGDPLKGPGDEVNEAVDEAVRRYGFVDGGKLAAGGASYGGHLANWLQATTTRYKAIVSHAGEMDLVMQWGTSDSIFGREVNSGGPVWGNLPVWREQSPVMQAGNHEKGTGFKTPILISVGELDYRVPANNALMNFATQQRLNVPSKLLVFPDENHWILKGDNSRYFYSEVHGWLAKYLK
ncbi:dipeptidyl aminopeptidase/acylaminoacyl peptidase [Duganella sp. 1411]|jgi:dipeptidyl aminopeptidase/acylaminoacyl peptidase|uniref:dipeptidyl-peptidase 5 n=1 Tax=Duganella sp. 1411 TaxID=2806572 RepID=UPI001AE547DE|nr:S9 family peptidase [Duganella sp. 1411]MBP1208172.1 dipeptidyl aminopeptidase/acylaminoacyl peptidase [Duganella sp. 1411]